MPHLMKIMLLLLAALTAGTHTHSQSPVSKLNTDEAVDAFITSYSKQHNLRWTKVESDRLAPFLKGGHPDDIAFGRAITRKKWVKHDFNRDGKTDLVFSGRFACSLACNVVAFITSADTLQHIFLTRQSFSYPHSISLVKKNGEEYLVFGEILHDRSGKRWRERYVKDTLTFQFGGFMEYRPVQNTMVKFDSLLFRQRSPWATVMVPDISVYADGRFKYRQRRFVKGYLNKGHLIYETFSATLTPLQLDTLQSLVQQVGFNSMPDHYEFPDMTDLLTANTYVYFNNGITKSVSDYGMQGTFGLQLLYRHINGLKRQAKWTLIKTEDTSDVPPPPELTR